MFLLALAIGVFRKPKVGERRKIKSIPSYTEWERHVYRRGKNEFYVRLGAREHVKVDIDAHLSLRLDTFPPEEFNPNETVLIME